MGRHAETAYPSTDLVVLPGGFSYGDYLRCGAIAARARSWAGGGTRERAGCDRHLQRLPDPVEAELLPGILTATEPEVHLQDVHLKVERSDRRSPAVTMPARSSSPGRAWRGNYVAGEGTVGRP